jgi:hypothetical protein
MADNKAYVKEKLKEILESTLESGLSYDGDLFSIDYFDLFCKATANEQLYKLLGTNLVMFRCEYENEESVLMLFSIPINSEEHSAKTVAERVMEVITEVEKTLITLDFVHSEEIKDEKFLYVTIIKKLKG